MIIIKHKTVKKRYVSNATASTKMFGSNFLGLPSKMHFSDYFYTYIPIVVYDMMHHVMCHYDFKSKVMRKIKQLHMLHHYQDEGNGYGVSSLLENLFFRSGFKMKADV